jgi:hypothetical protein
MRLRILIGTVILVVGLALYAAVVEVVAHRLLPARVPIEMVFYAIAGILWLPPAARLTRWMSETAPYRPPPGASP